MASGATTWRSISKRATFSVVDHESNAALVFMGVRRLVIEIARMRVVEDARRLAGELGSLNRHLYFNDWVPYEKRQSWLLQSDLSLPLHQARLTCTSQTRHDCSTTSGASCQ